MTSVIVFLITNSFSLISSSVASISFSITILLTTTVLFIFMDNTIALSSHKLIFNREMFLVISNIASGEIEFSDTRFVSIDYFNSLSDKRRPKLGDILFSVTGSFGIPAMVKDASP